MFGLEKNVKRLLGANETLFLAAFDHPQAFGVMDGLEDTPQLVTSLCETQIDGFILNPGMFPLLNGNSVYKKKMVMRVTLGGSKFSAPSKYHTVIVTPEAAIHNGADAVLIMMVLGGQCDLDSMTEVAKAIEGYHRLSIPVIVEVLNADLSKNNDADFVRDGARIAAEIGADIVKAFYCKNFNDVIAGCPVPVILAGGPKGEDIVEIAERAVASGVKGFAFGRNIFQHSDPQSFISNIISVLER